MKSIKEKRGITLIALAVTIVVLLILSAVTITFVLGEDGIINKAKEVANAMNNAVANDQKELDSLLNELNSVMNGWEEGGTGENEITNTEPTPPPKLPETVEEATGIQTENVKVKDKFGNVVTIPKGFEVVEQEGTTVPEGIVIQDKAGNQFVWIPVGRVYKDTTKNNHSDIQLGRYTFNTSNGTPTSVQLAYTDSNPKNYEQLVTVSRYHEEYATRANPDGIASDGPDGLNAIAKDLSGFVNSVKLNGGYYLARYEASYGSGSSVADYKPLSKVSTGYDEYDMIYKTGNLWNYVTQIDAAKISRNMYKNDSSVGVESDLVNSYAWDTVIVYIQAMGNENYSNKRSVNSSRANTGTIGDKVCNIHDMASNCFEWSTEYSAYADSSSASPCVPRGGVYGYSDYYTASRDYNPVTWNGSVFSFRPLLYIK